MDFVYNQLLKHDKSIGDLERLYPTMDRVLDDIGTLNRFKDLYTSTSLEGVAKGTVALESLHELRIQLNDFILNFNQWAEVIKGLQKSVEELKKENLELRGKLGATSTSSVKSVSSTTATVGSSSTKSVSSTTATVGAATTTPKSILKK